MRTIAIFVLSLALALLAGGNLIASAATTPAKPAAKTQVKAPTKTAPKPTAKTPAPKPAPAPRASGTLYRGTVKEVYAEDLMFAFKTGPGKLPYAVQILPSTRIVFASGAPATFEALASGQRVSVRGKLRSRTVIQAAAITVGG